MVEIIINEDVLDRAEKHYSFKKLRGSITSGESNYFGAVGEIITFDYFKEFAIQKNTYDYDLIIKGRTVDVKTKRTSVPPRPDFLCSVSAFNIKQACDFYFFCRVSERLDKAYLLGYLSKERFFELAKFKKYGELDVDGWEFKDDCYNVEISQLNQFKAL